MDVDWLLDPLLVILGIVAGVFILWGGFKFQLLFSKSPYFSDSFRLTPDESKEWLNDELRKYRDASIKQPNEPELQYKLSLLYDKKLDEENSILHMKNAEMLYRNNGNVKKANEANSILAAYYEKYGTNL